MKITVLMRMVPDVVEELEIASGGVSLDPESVRMVPSESDEHALEQALLLKESLGGSVTVVMPDAPEADAALYTAAAKGADRVVKIETAESVPATSARARILAEAAAGADLILTGVQAHDDLDALLAPLVARRLGLPHATIVTRVAVAADRKSATVLKELSGGVRGEFEAPLPAVLGIQAAEKPPRYVPVAKVRAAAKSVRIETVQAQAPEDAGPGVEILRMYKPEVASHAEMLEGEPEEVAEKVCEVLAARGLF
ncbi:MAG: electron transfer flavoprotein subunit beta [Bryobacteraceae bacterium]